MQSSGFRVQGAECSGFGMQSRGEGLRGHTGRPLTPLPPRRGLGVRAQALRLRVQGFGLRVEGVWFGVWDIEFRVQGLQVQVVGKGLGVTLAGPCRPRLPEELPLVCQKATIQLTPKLKIS